MTNAPGSEEISLEDIDKLLADEDPEFAQQLEEVRAVETDSSIEIESSVETEDGEETAEAAQPEVKQSNIIFRLLGKARDKWDLFRIRQKTRFKALFYESIVFLKTKPKEFAFYLITQLKALLQKIKDLINALLDLSRLQKITLLLLIAMGVGAVWLLKANLKGVWIPALQEPIIQSLESVADAEFTFDPKEVSQFYSAFPQERHEYLFDKIKINLRRTAGHANPMGAFELYVLLDSKDTAIEVRDREVEFFDLIQRTLEDESFESLEGEAGKNKLKSRLKRELNQKLTQGWVKDINFKTLILKP